MLLLYVEKVFTILALLFYTGAIAPFFPESDPRYFLVNIFPIPAFAFTLILISVRWQRVLSIAIRGVFLWIFVAIAVASPLWSDWTTETFEKVLPLVRVTVFAIYFSTCYSLRQQLQLLTWAFGIAAVLSFIICVAVPSRGVMGVGFISSMEDIVHTGKWRGIFIHKTELASWMVLTTIFSSFSAISTWRYRRLFWALSCLAVGLILKANSKGALVILFILLLLAYLYRFLRLRFNVSVPILIFFLFIVGGVAVVLISNTELIVISLGRDITFSGRTEFWPFLLDKVWERPWLGYGYEAFWEGGWKGEPADIWKYLKDGFRPPHAHNGVLEMLLSFGIAGFASFAVGYIIASVKAIAWVRFLPTIEGLLPLTYLTFMMLINLTESYLMKPDTYWILYISFTLSMFNKSINLAEAERITQFQSQLKISPGAA
jgi:O-antigen ligase